MYVKSVIFKWSLKFLPAWYNNECLMGDGFMIAEWPPPGCPQSPGSYSHPRARRCQGPRWRIIRKAGGEEWPPAWRSLPRFPLPWPCSSFGARLRP